MWPYAQERPSYRTHRSSTRQGFTYPRVTLSERVPRHRHSTFVRPERTDDGCRTAGIIGEPLNSIAIGGSGGAARRPPATTPQGDNHAAGPLLPRASWPRSRLSRDRRPSPPARRTTPMTSLRSDNPVDDNDTGGFDDGGLLGLLGLAGLAGLKRRNHRATTIRDDNLTPR